MYTYNLTTTKKANKIPKKFTGIIEYHDGTKVYLVNGEKHRLDGPAIEWTNGNKEYWVNGEKHRLDGPAIEWSDGRKEYWVEGIIYYSFENWQKKVQEILQKPTIPSCDGKVVEIDGKKYKLTEVE